MRDCPVCDSYSPEDQALIDEMGRAHHEYMALIREKEAKGKNIAPIIRTPLIFEAYAARTEFDE